MRALVIADGALSWETRPDPLPGRGQVLVSVRAAGINAGDLVQRAGFYPAPPGWPPDIPGMELAGEVAALGPGSTRFSVGDRVMAVVGGGAQAELALADEDQLMEVPDQMPWLEAGGFPEVFTTAFDALFTQCGLSMGEKVLVTGAAGGVGTAAVQLAAMAGAEVVASVRNPAMQDAVRSLGATHATDPVKALEFGPFDVALELVSGPSFAGTVGALATGGRLSVIGVGGGAGVELNLFALMQRRARIHGSTLRARSPSEKAEVARAVEAQVVPALGRGGMRVPILESFPMAQADAAYARFAEGGKLGKIVLVNQ